MPNYLEGDISTGGFFVESASGEIEDDKSNFDNLNNSASIRNDNSGLQQVGGLSFGINSGGGSKPLALHTEFATEGSDEAGRAYGTQDLTFYLQRADSDDNDPAEETLGEKRTDGVSGVVEYQGLYGDIDQLGSGLDSSGATGPNADNGSIQSGMNQIGAKSVAIGRSAGGGLAPIGNLDFDDAIDLGFFSQNASRFVDVSSSVINAVRSVKELNQSVINFSLASSERLFAKIVNKSFNPGLDALGTRSADDILDTLNRPGTSELSFLLASNTSGRIRLKDIARAVNDGEVGFVSAKSRAFQKRMGPIGRAPQ